MSSFLLKCGNVLIGWDVICYWVINFDLLVIFFCEFEVLRFCCGECRVGIELFMIEVWYENFLI